ncbi:sensor histidine kinase [Pedococcus bigeumensis]|uniref:histidine kinase n=1 Tax=Pedococcus bigeumensis TaxID=433644 RepID=A0A502CTB9_9MICO|nr:ATP-binding protein [Pedococcus bigeumensis]TPG16083.1 GAF domain-containing protein [Pedococcus bigeumensis]
MTQLASRSVSGQLKVLGISLVLLFPVVGAASVWNIASQSRDIQSLTLAYGPAFDANNAVLIDMTEANAGWSQLMGGSAPLTRYRLKRDQVAGDLANVQHAFDSPSLADEDRARYAALLATQRTAVDGWFRSAEAAEDGTTGTLSQRSVLEADAMDRFRLFRDSNRGLSEAIRLERDAAREGARDAVQWIVVIAAGTMLLAMAIVLGGWRLLARSVSGPLERLRSVVERQRDGDRDAQADIDSGAAEVRGLAADFNGLTRSNQVLQEQQSVVLRAHQLALDVARVVHGAPEIDTALSTVCAMLGEGLSVDRIMLYTHDESGVIDQRTQWHRHDLPDLPALPPSLASEVRVVGDELRRQATVFVLSDFLHAEVQTQARAARFYRATGAKSLLMVPVGIGEQGLGVLSLMTIETPRRWRRYEIQAVQQCAGYVAQSIVDLRLREMREAQVEQLTALDRQKTDFMATISHELRTPLTSINGYLELLEDGDYGDLSDPQRSALDIIGRNANRLRGLIEDLLVLNKIEATGLQSTTEDVAVDELVAGVADLLRPVADAAGVTLVIEPIDPELVIRVDRGQLERSLINLGSNAVKFTRPGGQATIGATEVDGRAVITVTDTGIGIPAGDLPQLFGRFFRASNATAAAIPGTGLGLAIVRAIVEGHGGELQVDSVEGRGTVMRVDLPVGNGVTPAAV